MTNEPTLGEVVRSIERNHQEVREDIRDLTARVNEIAALKVDVSVYTLQIATMQRDMEAKDKRTDALEKKIEALEKKDETNRAKRFTAMIGPSISGIIVGIALFALQAWVFRK